MNNSNRRHKPSKGNSPLGSHLSLFVADAPGKREPDAMIELVPKLDLASEPSPQIDGDGDCACE